VLQAFILGAGLGTRLRPLTDRVPKPLVPLFHRPLVEWALESCAAAGVGRFAVNTHHLPEMWHDPVMGLHTENDPAATPCVAGNGLPARQARWHDMPVAFFHEPVLLETGGGIRNISPWLDRSTLLVHNGDIFTTLPLDRLIAAHRASGLPVTLALRSMGDAKHIALDAPGTRVTDIRGHLDRAPGSHVFTGIYCVEPEFLGLIPPGEKISVIPAFLELARMGKLGAITLDEGVWVDLGNPTSYLRAHRELALGPEIHPDSHISPDARIERSVIGPGATVPAGAIIRDSVVWPGCRVEADANLHQCIVFSNHPAAGIHEGADL
jgi:mannose-1-phosphate guanylyltransferase